MKILHICLASFYIDNNSYQENMLPRYHKLMGYDVSVIASLVSFDKNGNVCLLKKHGQYFCNDGYLVTRLDYKYRFRYFNKIFRRYQNFSSTLKQEFPDIIFIHGCQFWDIRQIVKYKKKNLSVRIFVDNHADFINSATNFLSRIILHKVIWKLCAKAIEPYTLKFFGVTPLRCDFIKNVYKISPKKIDLLLLGADTLNIKFHLKKSIRNEIRKELIIADTDFVLVSGGKIDERKNIHLLIQAVNELKYENVKLILFGTPNLQMKPIIEKLSKSTRIRNIGWIPSHKVYDLYLASDLAVFPGTHSVLWEQSVGTGIPGVFKFWKGMDHVDLGGNCKFLFNCQVTEMKDILSSIIGNDTEYKRMKTTSEKKGIEKFSYLTISKTAIGI